MLDDSPAPINGLLGRYWNTWLDSKRTHPFLILVVKELGKAANTAFSDLKIVEIPDDVTEKSG